MPKYGSENRLQAHPDVCSLEEVGLSCEQSQAAVAVIRHIASVGACLPPGKKKLRAVADMSVIAFLSLLHLGELSDLVSDTWQCPALCRTNALEHLHCVIHGASPCKSSISLIHNTEERG